MESIKENMQARELLGSTVERNVQYMNYFTKDMWTGLGNKRNYKELKKKWENVIDEYNTQFENIKTRLSVSTYEYFKQYSFHDSKLISLNVLDINNFDKSAKEDIKQPLGASLKISSGYSEDIYIIEYKNVIKLNIIYSNKNQLFDYFCDSLGVIGYDELTDKDGSYLKHEFLFSTGSTIELVCKEINAYRLEEKK